MIIAGKRVVAVKEKAKSNNIRKDSVGSRKSYKI